MSRIAKAATFSITGFFLYFGISWLLFDHIPNIALADSVAGMLSVWLNYRIIGE